MIVGDLYITRLLDLRVYNGLMGVHASGQEKRDG